MFKRLLFILFIIIFLISLWLLFYVSFVLDTTKIRLPFVKENTAISVVSDTLSESPDICSQKDSLEYYYFAHDYPLWEPNNKFGIYIYPENDSFFELAQNLINSNGGDWGYVLIPYNVKDKDYEKWSRVFDALNSKHLIPIVQLYDVNISDYEKQTRNAAKFLNSFLWPIKYKYISVYNEPNDSKFWYGEADAEEYAQVLNYTIDTFKAENPDYFMLNGALNTSAPTDDNHIDAFEFMRLMNEEVPGIFSKLDGWASHPYPQPNFSGSPDAKGRWSIRAYESELDYIKNGIGSDKSLPVFITETGWAHAEGENYNGTYLSDEVVAQYFAKAYTDVWLPDVRVRAVTPFTIWYQPPFDHFSWVNRDRVPYFHYEELKKLKKVKGEPPVIKSEQYDLSGCL